MSTPSAAVRARSETAASQLPQTLDGFVAVHYRRLVRLAGLVCLDASEAQDAVQNALLRAWRNQHRLRDPARMKPWLDAIVVRESIRLNDRRRSWLRRLIGANHEPASRSPSPSRGAPDAAALDLILKLQALPAPQRAAVALHYEAGYTISEVADLLGVPHETVRSRLRLARQRLRRDLVEKAP
jgi:RNA polymerase sigma-70 factor (ECF subfamily)